MPKMLPSPARVLMLLALLLMLTGCAHKQPTPPVSGVPASVIPPLPKTSRQPEPPSECAPSCAAGLSQELNSWPALPMPPARPASSASGTTTP